MEDGSRITEVSVIPEDGTYLFTAEDAFTNEREIIVVPCEENGVLAWVNSCPHENQRFDRGSGAAMRDGEIVCPRHGSMFDACEGDCQNGPASGMNLLSVDVTIDGDGVVLTDDNYEFLHEGPIEEDEGPGSTSHVGF